MTIPRGDLAALGTAVCWTCSSLAFAASGRRIGSLSLNLIRLVIAFFYLTAFCWIRRGLPLPSDATPATWGWLAISGLIGFVLGDLCLFRAFVLIGPRISMLIMTLVPPIAALLGWVWLGERLGPADVLGMVVTLAGVAVVVLERQPVGDRTAGRDKVMISGAALALLGALGQAGGLVIAKRGMQHYDPFAAVQIRILAGIAGFSLLAFAARWWGRIFAALRHREGMALAALGAFAGPFLGVSLSLIAVQETKTGVAATLMATVPVLLIPAVFVIHRERVSLRGAIGAVVAVGGVALLWLL